MEIGQPRVKRCQLSQKVSGKGSVLGASACQAGAEKCYAMHWTSYYVSGTKTSWRHSIPFRVVACFCRDSKSGKSSPPTTLKFHDSSCQRAGSDKFLKRNNIVLRRTATVCQRPPSDFIDRICNFVLFVQRKITNNKLGLAAVYGANETAVGLDPSAATLLAPQRVRDASVRSIGHDKLRITVILAAHANGQKCLPFVLVNASALSRSLKTNSTGSCSCHGLGGRRRMTH